MPRLAPSTACIICTMADASMADSNKVSPEYVDFLFYFSSPYCKSPPSSSHDKYKLIILFVRSTIENNGHMFKPGPHRYIFPERGGSVVMHETRIREIPGSNPGADQPDWGFSWFYSIIKANAGLDFHYHDPLDHYSSNSYRLS